MGNKIETSLQVVLPAALSGVGAALIIGISRRRRDHDVASPQCWTKLHLDPSAAETMTKYIARIGGRPVKHRLITPVFCGCINVIPRDFGFNLISQVIVERFREKYE